jgi:tetratricopeptide (TPR) repeat protein
MPSSRELFKKAYQASNEENYDLAEKNYRQALEIDPNYSMAWNNLGWILFDQKQKYNEAEKCYSKAIKLDKKNYFAMNNLGIFYYRQKKDYKKAERVWKGTIKINPEFVHVWKNLGVLYEFQLINPKKSKECYEKAESIIQKQKLTPDKDKITLKCSECGNLLESGQKICEQCGTNTDGI